MDGIPDSAYYRVFFHPDANPVKNIPEAGQSYNLVKFQEDTLHAISGTFFHGNPSEMIQKINPSAFPDWMIWGLLFFSFFLAVFWFYTPEQILSIFSVSGKKSYFRKIRQITDYEPSVLIKLFLVFTYWFTISLFVFLIIDHFAPQLVERLQLPPKEQVLYISGAIVIFFLYRYIFIVVMGFVFKTADMASKQLKLYLNTDYVTGMILIPLLLLILLINIDFLFYLALFFVVIIFFVRWLISYKISKSNPGFTSLHLFMYLCTLEMIPFLLLVKMLELRFI